MKTLSPLQQDILWACMDDYTGLFLVIACVQRNAPGVSASEVQRKTLEALQPLFEEGLLQAGFARGRAFERWLLSPAKVMDRIAKEWTALGRDPSITDVAWFEITQRGIGLLQKLDSEAVEGESAPG